MDYHDYPRVTQVLSATEDKEKSAALLRWQKKMEKVHGIEGAKRERNAILRHGTDTHTAIEKYLADDPYDGHIDISGLHSFLDIIKTQSKLLVIEDRLFCHKYKFQGKPDLICVHNGLTTIFDWTTSKALKKRAWIEHKFIQAGAYSIAARLERNMKVEQLGVVVVVEGRKKPQTFFTDSEDPNESVEHYQKVFLDRLEQFKLLALEPY